MGAIALLLQNPVKPQDNAYPLYLDSYLPLKIVMFGLRSTTVSFKCGGINVSFDGIQIQSDWCIG